ncbi:DUF5050 domain-containing protein [Clostridium sp. 19966]|uniref:DUF5050 domain-containing protein n=1 Tax=Clostridium sp. 19966 TaxID=2768166 RepID=UPI0028DFF160|nr:DUF5050 domain-containing protein [Clostridium sp. 19966]
MVHSLQDGVTNSSIIIKNSNVSDLNFVDGWIYFLMEGSGIYKCKPDGSEKTMVLSGDFADLICHKNDVYYIDSSGDLVKNDINNLENNQQIIDSALNFILSEDGSKLFYSQIQENKNQIMEYDLKTNKKILLVENSNSYLQAAFSYKSYLYFYEINKNQSNNVNPYQHMNLSKINIAIANSKVEQYMTDLSSENPLNENNGYIYYTKKISLGNKALAVRDLSNNEELSIPIKDDVIYDYQYSSYSLYAFDKTAYLYSNENYYVYIFDIENKSYKKVYLDADHATYQLNKN